MKLIIYTDGGSRGNPGQAGIGVVFCNEKKQILKEYGERIGVATNNEAEYQAVVFALQKARQLFGKEKVKQANIYFYLDSELVVKQLNHQYKIEEGKLQPLFMKIWNLLTDFGEVKFTHIPREENKLADKLVNDALDEKISSNLNLL